MVSDAPARSRALSDRGGYLTGGLPGRRGMAAMLKDLCPVRWAGRRAVVALPADMDVSNAGQIGEELLPVINGGATALIADMTATVLCDHAGAGAVVRAFQRAVISDTELRLVVTAPIVSRVLSLSGVDRLVPIQPSLEEARAPAREPGGGLVRAGAVEQGAAT
jgi:anti-sigma B factor antagonist